MKAIQVVLGTVTIGVWICGCAVNVVEHDFSVSGAPLGAPATLDYRSWLSNGIDLVEVDAHPYETAAKSDMGYPTALPLFKLDPGTHKVRFKEIYPWANLRPDVVEFEARAGKRYRADFEEVSDKVITDKGTTLYFNFRSPVVLEEQNGKFVKVASGATAPFGAQFDADQSFLVYQEHTLPEEKTARVDCPRAGAFNAQLVFVLGISGRSGETQLEFRRSSKDPSRFRLLPGEYRFDLTMEGGKWRVGTVQSGTRSATLNAEAGHTYLINANVEAGDTTFSTNAIGATQMQSVFNWSPTFEDVTGMEPVDE